MNAIVQHDFFRAPLERAPVTWAWGVGVDSTSGIIEMHARGEPIDMVLTADMPERTETLRFRDVFMKWMKERDIPCEVVSYSPKNFKNFPPYYDLLSNCLTNGTLPSIAFGFSSCSQKWKAAPQNTWLNTWDTAQTAWAQGLSVVRCIGYDASPRDSQRYAHAEGYLDAKYEYRYPLREWGWTRDQCEERIIRELGYCCPKSSCFFCTASKPHEIDALTKVELRLIVLLEARAAPRLKTTEGLWRKSTKGARGGVARPGSMTTYIKDRGLLDVKEVELIWNEAPTALIAWQEAHSSTPIHQRPALQSWIDFFAAHGAMFEGDGVRTLYGDSGYDRLTKNLEYVRSNG